MLSPPESSMGTASIGSTYPHAETSIASTTKLRFMARSVSTHDAAAPGMHFRHRIGGTRSALLLRMMEQQQRRRTYFALLALLLGAALGASACDEDGDDGDGDDGDELVGPGALASDLRVPELGSDLTILD